MKMSLASMAGAVLVLHSTGFGYPAMQLSANRGVLLVGVSRSIHCTFGHEFTKETWNEA